MKFTWAAARRAVARIRQKVDDENYVRACVKLKRPIESITIEDRLFPISAKRPAWGYCGIDLFDTRLWLEIADEREDLEFLTYVSNSGEDARIVLTMSDGHVYFGRAKILAILPPPPPVRPRKLVRRKPKRAPKRKRRQRVA